MTKLSGSKPRPWVKLWREERGLFAQLPLFARALDRELHVICNEEGVIDVGPRPHADAVAFALGADRSDRRLLRRFLPELEAAGRLRLEPGRIVLLAWQQEQEQAETRGTTAPPSDPTASRPGSEATTTATRTDPDRATIAPPPCNEDLSKSAESCAADPQRREEKRREDQEEDGAAAAAPSGRDFGDRERGIAAAFKVLHAGWDERYQTRFGAPTPVGSQTVYIRRLATWVDEAVEGDAERASSMCVALLDALFARTDGFARNVKRYSLELVLEEPRRYLDEGPAGMARAGRRRAETSGAVVLRTDPDTVPEFSDADIPEEPRGEVIRYG